MCSKRESRSLTSQVLRFPGQVSTSPDPDLKTQVPLANFLGLGPGDQQVMRKLFAPYARGCPDLVAGGLVVSRGKMT